jgi:catechol 2,3-dioxygenase-like lactoylglutathione lyase family enzyme
MNIEFLSTVAVIAPDPPASRELYLETLGLPLEGHGSDYFHSEQIAGCKSFGIWPLSQAAEACFGTSQWPVERPVPQVSIEFDVADAAAVGPAARGDRVTHLRQRLSHAGAAVACNRSGHASLAVPPPLRIGSRPQARSVRPEA